VKLKADKEKKSMLENVVSVSPENLAGEIAKTKYEGYRFVTMTCVELDADTVELIYHFDRDFTLRNIRLTALKNMEIPSISHIFMAAFLVENEIQDMFHLKFNGLIIDFNQTLYFDDETQTAPLCRYTVRQTKSPEPGQSQNPGDA
jgi:ech hydrogenase subunit D